MRIKFFILQVIILSACRILGSSSTCIYEGKSYEEGKFWNTSCSICSCRSNLITCSNLACAEISCLPEGYLNKESKDCCPQCKPYKRSCNIDSVSYLHDEVWASDSKCVFYHCQDGVAVEYIIQCQNLVCLQGENIFTIPGECCPKCMNSKCIENFQKGMNHISSTECFHMNFSRKCEQKINSKQDKAILWKDNCTFCVTENGGINCYYRKCPVCSSYYFNMSNDSCCSCPENNCEKNCLRCLKNDSYHCIYCEDSKSKIYNGKCIKECPIGFFTNDMMTCQGCLSPCQTCFGNLTSQCSSCESGYLLQMGHCVNHCDVNFYEYQNHCYDCHKSCSSCIGPSENDCITCALSGQLLQNGRCVDDCEGHSYRLDGYCYACNESCVRCLKNGTCQFCETGYYLEEGFCLPECSPGYYTFHDAYCLVCHEECQECFGPLPYQCTSCPFNQYLLQNSCVWDCGQGYFGDLGAGVCRPCHPKCRACLGGSDDKCLSCSSGYLLPYIGTHFGSCIKKCPEKYYLMETGVCGLCFETCQTCFGPNDTECTSCNSSLLLKDNSCITYCPHGYFLETGVCYACHPSCATCNGFGENECITCPHGRTLEYHKCISLCKDGKYMKLNGSCYDCHSSCADCLLNSDEFINVQCIRCKNQQQSILKDQCIEECAENFYLNSYHICIECNPTCATCEKSGATSCASCWDGNFLTHLGTCEPQCHPGYYPMAGICEACSLNCHNCIDTLQCLQCKGDLVLQFGRCVLECDEQHYMDTVSRACKECSLECLTCRGPLSTDCTSCIPGKLFQDGVCVTVCSNGFYQDVNHCKTCDLNCQSCSSLKKCTSCDFPLYLLNNECVDDCGAKHYEDFDSLSCKACSFGCTSCVSSVECSLCSLGYYMLNYECFSHCPYEYFSDPIRRICKKNIDTPLLTTHGILSIQPGRRIFISASFISASDTDSDHLTIKIINLPNNGFLLKMSNKGEEIHLNIGDNFTSSLLNDGWIFFEHSKGIPLEGDVIFKISDGQLFSNEISLPLYVSSAFPPTVEQTRNIILSEESIITLNSSFFSIKDADNLEDVTIQIVKGPCFGKLVSLPDKTEVLFFSYEEFMNNKLALKAFNNNNTVHDDRLTFRISDGYNSIIIEFQIYILPQTQKQLFLMRNKPLLAKSDEFIKLSNEQVLAIGDGLFPNMTIFSLKKSAVSAFGNFYKKVKPSSERKQKIDTKTIIFTQEDINQGLIYYKQNINSTSNFVIQMKVINAISNTALNFNFDVQVLQYDSILKLNEKTKQFGMMVSPNQPTNITNDYLQMQQNGISSSDILYMITKELSEHEGFLENLDKPGYKLQSFTQNDIDNMKVIYHPPPYAAIGDNYIFKFIVLDSRKRIQLSPALNFTITIQPLSTEIAFPSSSIDHEVSIKVPQGKTVEMGSNWLSTTGHKIADDQLEVILSTEPQHGKLFHKQNGVEIEIDLDGGYSFSSILNDAYYTHDGSHKFKDYAVFKIMGGPYSSLNKINFIISPDDQESPVILDSTTLMGSVIEGEYLDLRRYHLAFTDLISDDDEIVFTVINEPKYGKLGKKQNEGYQILKYGDSFSQQDINDFFIRYIAISGIGNKTVRDFLYFNVSDASGNIQSDQVLTMTVKPKIREPPIVRVMSDVKVNESGEAIIEPHVITVFHPDSPLSDLVVYIEKQPDYGFLENFRPIPGAESSLGGFPISSFPYIDLVESYIKYTQVKHRGMEPERDTVYIRIEDGHLSSSVHLVNITIKPINDEIPHVYAHHLSVLQGGYVKILNSTLAIIDEDTPPNQLFISLDYPPKRGELRLMESSNYNFKDSKLLSQHDTFIFQHVLNGLLMYVHKEQNSDENDTFSFSVSDGHHTISSVIDIIVTINDREVPYLLRNLGLELMPGESSVINNKSLSAHDLDSFVKDLKYTITSDPSSGRLFLTNNGVSEMLSSDPKFARMNHFTQDDIDEGKVVYHHYIEQPVGLHYFKFNVEDPGNNILRNQKFFISISEDMSPPILIRNTGLEVQENSYACINSNMLAAVDEYQKNKDLIFSLSMFPLYGYLEMKDNRGKSISKFLMSDLIAGNVCYVQKSMIFSTMDSFSFTVSDGKNYILQTFLINITALHTNVPFVKIHPLLVQEGYRKTITEFEIDIFDRDTLDSNVIIIITLPPKHGTLIQDNETPIRDFSVDDIKYGRVSYHHDDSDTVDDSFSFFISNGLNKEIIFINDNKNNVTTVNPVVFPIKILPIDDVFPVLVKNEGLHFLNKTLGKVWNRISKNVLLSEDADTNDKNILYRITLQPRYGYLELMSNLGEKIIQFTQDDINKEFLLYTLKNDDLTSTEDWFMFSVEDTKPNKIFNNIFNINWTRIRFNSSLYSTSETSGLLQLSVIRIGNKNMDFTAFCMIEKMYSHQQTDDSLISIVDEVHFKRGDSIKFCVFKIIDNTVFEGRKEFKVSLQSELTLMGSPRFTNIHIIDEEDEPIISFREGIFKVNETNEIYGIPVIRTGDLRQELSVLCETSSMTALGSKTHSLQSGSDYKSRDSSYNSFISFNPGISETMCYITIIDDNLYEEEEEFVLTLSNPHPVGKVQNFTKARVFIQGPNDEPSVFIQVPQNNIFFLEKNSSLSILRQGVDISSTCSVRCGSQLKSFKKESSVINSYHQITFQSFETSVVCPILLEQNASSVDTLTVFLDSPHGCILGYPNKITVAVKRKVVKPIIQFGVNFLSAAENIGTIQIPVFRIGELSNSTHLLCITEDITAKAKKDFKERYKSSKNSLIHFNPGQKETQCPLIIYDDESHEGIETLRMKLLPLENENELIMINDENFVSVEIIDPEDATVIEFEKFHYLVVQNSFLNTSASTIISVVRHGDVSYFSKIRISTIDGSASSGRDYHAKSKMFTFKRGEKKKDFEIEILYNRQRNWALSFTVILGPDDVINAEIGNISKTTVTIPRIPSTESLILPSIPVVVSLIHYNDVAKGMKRDAKSGYPLICITPCDMNYPDYNLTNTLCGQSGITTDSLRYFWEISMPLNSEQIMSPYERITDSTIFTSTYDKILDSIYFRPHEKVRCIAQPSDSKGHLGIPLRSKPIKISSESGFCATPKKMPYSSPSLSTQPFIVTLDYVNSTDDYHPNKLHVHVEIPHEDGLLPLISTYPLHNIEFLLMQDIYRQQHVCSNLLQSVPTDKSFLKNFHPDVMDIKKAFPYHPHQSTNEMMLIYQHLDLKKCKWSFDAWYSMSDLVDLCGGTVVSDFKARDTDRMYISVLLPFYVTYIFATAPTGWTSVEHHTELEFSFFYETFLWKLGSRMDDSLKSSLNIVRIGTDYYGHLFFEFKTIAKFYGCFILEHHTIPGIKSHLSAPSNLNVKFDLELLWSEQTFDGPTQFWKATSNYNLKDYSGHYTVYLIPCEVAHTEQFFMYRNQQFLPCIIKAPQKFDLPIVFQQTLRPEPVTYALDTFFQLFNDESLFLLNPFEHSQNFQYIEYKGAFSKGDKVYGKVFWSPTQQLNSAYQLKINKVLLCSGMNGLKPTYDPTGKVFGKGSQYGCLMPSKSLKHKFVLLDRHNPENINLFYQGLPFNAMFIEDVLEYTKMSEVLGVDGFVFKIDPLYQVSTDHQWFLQVAYTIKPMSNFRHRRTLQDNEHTQMKEENQTNIKIIILKINKGYETNQAVQETNNQVTLGVHHYMYMASVLLLVFVIIILKYRKCNSSKHEFTTVFGNYTWMRLSKSNHKCCEINYSNPKNEIANFVNSLPETEV